MVGEGSVGPQAVKSHSLGENRLPCETRTDFSQPACFCSCSRQLLRATYCSPWRLETKHLHIVWVMGALYIKCLQQSEKLRTGRARGAHGREGQRGPPGRKIILPWRVSPPV